MFAQHNEAAANLYAVKFIFSPKSFEIENRAAHTKVRCPPQPPLHCMHLHVAAGFASVNVYGYLCLRHNCCLALWRSQYRNARDRNLPATARWLQHPTQGNAAATSLTGHVAEPVFV